MQKNNINLPITYTKLSNGLRAVVAQDHSSPVATVAVFYQVGFRSEIKGRTGFAHLFEHLMFQGTKNIPKNPKLEKLCCISWRNIALGKNKVVSVAHLHIG